MRVVVFGATGGTGQSVIQQALLAGHEVTAVARRPEAFRLDHERLRVARGDVTHPASIEAVVVGADAVVSALGVGRSRSPTMLYSAGIASVIAAMRVVGVRRLLAVSAAGFAVDANDTLALRLVVKPLLKRVLRHPYADMGRMEEAIVRSDLDWTLIRPARLTDRPGSGRYRTAVGANVRGGWSLPRADLASFIVTHLDDPTTSRMTVAVAS